MCGILKKNGLRQLEDYFQKKRKRKENPYIYIINYTVKFDHYYVQWISFKADKSRGLRGNCFINHVLRSKPNPVHPIPRGPRYDASSFSPFKGVPLFQWR